MLMWRGWGIVVAGIALAAFFVGGMAGEALGADGRWTVAAAGACLIPAGVGTWFLGKRMNRNSVRELIDPKTGQPVLIRNDHSLFFLPVEWWGPIMVVVGVVVLVAGIVSPSVRH